MKPTETRDEWLARIVAKAEESVKAGRVLTHEEAEAKMAAFKADFKARLRGKAA